MAITPRETSLPLTLVNINHPTGLYTRASEIHTRSAVPPGFMEVGLSCLSEPAPGLQVKGARLLDFVGGFSTQLVVWGFEPHLFFENHVVRTSKPANQTTQIRQGDERTEKLSARGRHRQ